jgi:hypothetical protein
MVSTSLSDSVEIDKGPHSQNPEVPLTIQLHTFPGRETDMPVTVG